MSKLPENLSTRIIRSGVDWSCAGQSLVDMLAGRFTYRTREEWAIRIASGEITVNNLPAVPEQQLKLHDVIEYRPRDIVEPPAELDYRIVYEDSVLLVVDKPGNLCIHPAGPFFKNTLWHLLCTRYGKIHFINRLDRETSGLLLVAKDAKTARDITAHKSLESKIYQVIVHGDFPEKLHAAGFLKNGTSAVKKKRVFVTEKPDLPPFEYAETTFSLLAKGNGLSLLQAELATGRMHQIRATLSSLGFPVAGDKLYGVNECFYLRQKDETLTEEDHAKLLISRQALHSCKLSFRHPEKDTLMEFTSPLPEELQFLTRIITGK